MGVTPSDCSGWLPFSPSRPPQTLAAPARTIPPWRSSDGLAALVNNPTSDYNVLCDTCTASVSPRSS